MTALNQKVLKDIKKSFEDVHLLAKIYWISPYSQLNSTTVIMLLLTMTSHCTKLERHYEKFNYTEEPSLQGIREFEFFKDWWTIDFAYVVEFIVWQLKFNWFLHPNEYSQKIFWYFARQHSWEPTQMGYIFTMYIEFDENE